MPAKLLSVSFNAVKTVKGVDSIVSIMAAIVFASTLMIICIYF